ncbi:MAG: phosphoribosylanthranilate isomerase [Nitrospirae bacterium]|nr:phosphoribosylanthranilate isomerase [Nitrospirota bacterium]
MALWIKICGITNPADARLVALSGADAVGLIFSEKSPRFVTIAAARSICAALPPSMEKVGVFVLPEWERIGAILEEVPLDVIQWHGGDLGAEGYERLSRFGLPWIHAVRWTGREPLSFPPSARNLLVEGYSEKAPGGTGQSWDYRRLSFADSSLPLVLSGGLAPETVGGVLESLGTLRLSGVDVSSGVEKRPGIKDEGKVMEFVRNVRDWERNQ